MLYDLCNYVKNHNGDISALTMSSLRSGSLCNSSEFNPDDYNHRPDGWYGNYGEPLYEIYSNTWPSSGMTPDDTNSYLTPRNLDNIYGDSSNGGEGYAGPGLGNGSAATPLYNEWSSLASIVYLSPCKINSSGVASKVTASNQLFHMFLPTGAINGSPNAINAFGIACYTVDGKSYLNFISFGWMLTSSEGGCNNTYTTKINGCWIGYGNNNGSTVSGQFRLLHANFNGNVGTNIITPTTITLNTGGTPTGYGGYLLTTADVIINSTTLKLPILVDGVDGDNRQIETISL